MDTTRCHISHHDRQMHAFTLFDRVRLTRSIAETKLGTRFSLRRKASKKEALRAHRIVRGVPEQLQQRQPKKRCKRASLLFELCQKYAVKSFHTDSAAVLTKNYKFLSSPRSSAEKERTGAIIFRISRRIESRARAFSIRR